jgi:hypothetical protein
MFVIASLCFYLVLLVWYSYYVGEYYVTYNTHSNNFIFMVSHVLCVSRLFLVRLPLSTFFSDDTDMSWKRARGAKVDDTAQATTVTLSQRQPAVAEFSINSSVDSTQLVDLASASASEVAAEKVETAEKEEATAKEEMATAKHDMATAKHDMATAKQEMVTAKQEMAAAKNATADKKKEAEMNLAKAEMNLAKAEMNLAKAEMNLAKTDPSKDRVFKSLEKAYDGFVLAHHAASVKYNSLVESSTTLTRSEGMLTFICRYCV